MKSMSVPHERAIARARFVQQEINHLRASLAAERVAERKQFRDVGDTYDDVPNAALLASYDRELDRLCAVDGVMTALLEDLPTHEPT